MSRYETKMVSSRRWEGCVVLGVKHAGTVGGWGMLRIDRGGHCVHVTGSGVRVMTLQ